MGQSQSGPAPQQQEVISQKPVEDISTEERERQAAEDRARRLAATEKRLAAQKQRHSAKPGSDTTTPVNGKKKLSALEEASRENLGWRNADEGHALRSWN
ncbi:hypothetical protein GQ43DRAFT_442701 [Delitschia confertaspora ATCC 74209]|uniref:Uncharacterized protein n=1 Tax=Delitschia confertaspora ATCC 74209 TaxID=1513339 RepID=A0A9P4MQB8_9PLEO|nr:hypothetical protein GQ43DRAFT_442701 [Delitschia confertaspora ATCC 74209]